MSNGYKYTIIIDICEVNIKIDNLQGLITIEKYCCWF